MDTVFVEGLEVSAVVGVFDWERSVEQALSLDLELAWDNSVPAGSDDVADALDYGAVCETVRHWFREHQPALLETAAEAIASELIHNLGVGWVRLVLHKPGAVPGTKSVGVSIERGARS